MIEEKSERLDSNEVLQIFWDLHYHLIHAIQRTATNHQLSVPQYAILIMLHTHQQLTQKQVREKTLLPKSTLSQAVNGLVEAGLIERKSVKDDRREVLLLIHEKGIEQMMNIQNQKYSVNYLLKQATDTLTNDELAHFNDILEQITDYFND